MKNTLTPKKLVRLLRRVPEKEFRIGALAPQLLTPDGKVDIEKCIDKHVEIKLAVEEVRRYISECHSIRCNLERPGSSDWDDEEEEVGGEDGL